MFSQPLQANLMASTNPFLANSNVVNSAFTADFSQPQLVQVGATDYHDKRVSSYVNYC